MTQTQTNKDTSSSVCLQDGSDEKMKGTTKLNDKSICEDKMSGTECDVNENRSSHIVLMILPWLVLMDMVAVSLVVPLLHVYMKRAGMTSAVDREYASFYFSSSQILGGILMGLLTTTGAKSILLGSFAGSAVSYGLLYIASGANSGSYYLFIASRILVGLVKQTMTVSTSLLAQHTNDTNRSTYMGRLSAGTTAAWLVGPSLGALLYQHLDERAPLLIACVIFVIITIVATIILPSDNVIIKSNAKNKKGLSSLSSIFLWEDTLKHVAISTVLFHFLTRATSYTSMGNFYEQMYGIESHERGYLRSYQSVLSLIIQTFGLKYFVKRERQYIVYSTLTLGILALMETQANLYSYTLIIIPIMSLSNIVLYTSLRSLLVSSTTSSTTTVHSVLATMDVFQNAASVTVPFYRTFLFQLLDSSNHQDDQDGGSLLGDPHPQSWLVTSGLHWIVGSIIFSTLLLSSSSKKAKTL